MNGRRMLYTVILIAAGAAAVLFVLYYQPVKDGQLIQNSSEGYANPQLLVEPDWLEQHKGEVDVRVIDVRSKAQYDEGHIPDAENVEWSTAMNSDGTFKSADKLTKIYRTAEITPDKEVVVYCQSGHRASHGYLVLRLLGYPNVRVYNRSWSEWGNRSDLPIER